MLVFQRLRHYTGTGAGAGACAGAGPSQGPGPGPGASKLVSSGYRDRYCEACGIGGPWRLGSQRNVSVAQYCS